MDYDEEKQKGEMSKTSFIAIIVLCLLAIGAVSYLAISGMKTKVEEDEKSSKDSKTYSSNDSSYNSSITEPGFDIPQPSSSVGKTESEIPYEESSEPTGQAEINNTHSFIMPVDGNISKGFSDTSLQYSATYGDMRLHTGIDILCRNGTDVKSASDGTVVSVEDSATLGRCVNVQCGDEYTVKYCGLESLNVKEGDEIRCGTVLGTSGTVPCEANDQPHIHVEVYFNGTAVSPIEAFGLN